MHRILRLIPLVLLFPACTGNGSATDTTVRADSTAAPIAAIDLSSHGLPLLFLPPEKQLTGGADPMVVWKDELGQLQITAGEHFGLSISEEPADLPRLKDALDRDLLKKNTVVQEVPDALVYKSEFPDDPSLVFIHFYQVLTVGGRTFVVQDLDGLRFNEQDVQRMRTSISPAQPA